MLSSIILYKIMVVSSVLVFKSKKFNFLFLKEILLNIDYFNVLFVVSNLFFCVVLVEVWKFKWAHGRKINLLFSQLFRKLKIKY